MLNSELFRDYPRLGTKIENSIENKFCLYCKRLLLLIFMEINKIKPRVVVSGRVKPELAKKVAKGAKIHKMSMSEVIEKALDIYYVSYLSWKPVEK